MKYLYKGQIVTANSKEEAKTKVVAKKGLAETYIKFNEKTKRMLEDLESYISEECPISKLTTLLKKNIKDIKNILDNYAENSTTVTNEVGLNKCREYIKKEAERVTNKSNKGLIITFQEVREKPAGNWSPSYLDFIRIRIKDDKYKSIYENLKKEFSKLTNIKLYDKDTVKYCFKENINVSLNKVLDTLKKL